MVWFSPNCFTLLKFVLKDFGHSVLFRYPEPAHQAEQFFIMENIQQFSKVVQFIGGCLHRDSRGSNDPGYRQADQEDEQKFKPTLPGKDFGEESALDCFKDVGHDEPHCSNQMTQAQRCGCSAPNMRNVSERSQGRESNPLVFSIAD
jgi:hypothetical protein